MAKIENRSERPYHITGLPTTDSKGVATPGATFIIPAKAHGHQGAPGVGEIPDDVLSELLSKDAFTKAAFVSDLARVSEKASHREEETRVETDNKTKGHGR